MAEKTATIEFEEHPGVAFIVRLSPVALDDWLDIDARLTGFVGKDELLALIDRFAEVAFLGVEGSDKEPSAATLRQYDSNVILSLIREWSKAIARAPLPLPVASGAGGPSKARRASKNRKN